jgi:ABC-type multidrug transport system ATPase subunit
MDLVKVFGPIRAVDDVSFDLAAGRIYGMLGPNGSGKTTLIRLLIGLTRATAGRAEVLGTPMPSRPMLGRIGYMTQSDGIYPALTVGENARFFAATYGVDGSSAVSDALRVVDLGDRVDSIAARRSSCRATSWTRPTAATSCCSSAPARSSPEGPASRSGPRPGHRTSSRPSCASAATPW